MSQLDKYDDQSESKTTLNQPLPVSCIFFLLKQSLPTLACVLVIEKDP